MDLGGASWAIMTIVGPLILAGVLLWVLLKNRKRRPREDERTEPASARDARRGSGGTQRAARRANGSGQDAGGFPPQLG